MLIPDANQSAQLEAKYFSPLSTLQQLTQRSGSIAAQTGEVFDLIKPEQLHTFTCYIERNLAVCAFLLVRPAELLYCRPLGNGAFQHPSILHAQLDNKLGIQRQLQGLEMFYLRLGGMNTRCCPGHRGILCSTIYRAYEFTC
ncbi:hypothetical protein ABB27_00840 [Stenotrophomonas terrae]|uniref:Uncharacterized protein n=1 Tax=Stenotrophomonas terrae TaxID=405446 RepID=A0A0R0D3D4_9GAMM|nr:hypothetical protein ABB27_00840 [Stenotrophomonas terrae]